MSGHALHPEAYEDLDDIRGYMITSRAYLSGLPETRTMPSKGLLRAVSKQHIDKPVPYRVQIYFVK
jgi:hypothetical protein